MTETRAPSIELRTPWLGWLGLWVLSLFPFAVAFGLLALVERRSGVDLPLVALAVGLVVLRQAVGFVISGLYHRSMSHGSVRFAPWLERALRVVGWLGTGLGSTTYAAVHRWHHAHADTADDPSLPSKPGGTLLNVGFQDVAAFRRVACDRRVAAPYLRGLPDDRLERFVNAEERRGFGMLGVRALVVLGLPALGFAAAGVPLPWAAVAAVACFIAVSGSAIAVASYGVNGLAHRYGRRPFATDDTSTNLVRWDLLALGEALHNNHHARPGVANFAAAADEWDPTCSTLRLLRRVGAVRALTL